MTARAGEGVPSWRLRKKLRLREHMHGAASTLTDEQKAARTKLRNLYKKVKLAAISRDVAEIERKAAQRDAVALAKEFGLTDTPVRFTLDGHTYSATVICPEPQSYWDQEAVVDYLHRTGRWDDCSTQTFDQEKFEAEIAKGNIPRSAIKKFVRQKDPTTPYCKIQGV